jgi:hypothetical protein
MLEYFYSSDALTCLRVCKFLKNLLNDREIEMLRIKVVKLIAMEEQLAWLDALHIQCKLCGAENTRKDLSKENLFKELKRRLIRHYYVNYAMCLISGVDLIIRRGVHWI